MTINENDRCWHIYLLRTNTGAIYTGITTHVQRRFNEHNAQGSKCAKSLRGKGPFTLELNQLVGNKNDALKLEYKIKQLNKEAKEFLIRHKYLLYIPGFL